MTEGSAGVPVGEFWADTAVIRAAPMRRTESAEPESVEPEGGGRFSATVTDRWSLLTGNANGGYVMGLAMRALAQTVPHPDPVAVSATYLRQAWPGPAEIDTELVRAGRRLSVGEARLSLAGKETLRVVASFSDLSDASSSRVVQTLDAPQLPPPEQCLQFADAPMSAEAVEAAKAITLGQRMDYRYPSLPGWITGTPTGAAQHEFWMRFADGTEPATLSLPSLVDSAMPAAPELKIWRSTTVELTCYVRARPQPGWLACRVSTRHLSVGGFHEEDFEIWDSSGVLVAQSRQLMLDLDVP